jgi:hypothetical protein
MRGSILPLTRDHVLERVASLLSKASPLIQYSHLPGQNGGFDPRAPDCASRWERNGMTLLTSDCVGFYCWVRGVDRYQPVRFPLFGGWQNTDSIIQDAKGRAKCWRIVDRPYPGCAVVYPGTFLAGVRVKMGHIGAVWSVPAEYAPKETEWWREVKVADCHGPRLKGRAIGLRDASIWQKRGVFVEWCG